MSEGIHRMQQQHPGTGHPHHLFDLLSHIAFVTMHGAGCTSGFFLAKGATLQSLFRITEQCVALIA
jgi:hypothetical protein